MATKKKTTTPTEKKKTTKAKSPVVEVWPIVVEGTHLTVYRYEDGSSKLKWDDEALLKEVREATK